MTEQPKHTKPPERSLPRWARWALLAAVFGGTALAFYFNFGRMFERMYGE